METIKYIKNQSNNMMKNLLYFFVMLNLLFISVNAVNQETLFNYEFEEGAGNIVLDTSGNDNHLVANGLVWTIDNVNDIYAVDLDGSNDYAQGVINLQNLSQFSFSTWVKPWSNSKDSIFVFYTPIEDLVFKIEIDPDAGNNNLRLVYTNELSVSTDLDLDSTNFNTGTYYHLSFTYDFIANEFKYYRDSVLINTFSNVDITSLTSSSVSGLGIKVLSFTSYIFS